jgi:hypothetical protein
VVFAIRPPGRSSRIDHGGNYAPSNGFSLCGPLGRLFRELWVRRIGSGVPHSLTGRVERYGTTGCRRRGYRCTIRRHGFPGAGISDPDGRCERSGFVRRSLTNSTGAFAPLMRRRRRRRPNDMARQARGLWARLRTAWLERRIAPGRRAPSPTTNGSVGRNFLRRSSSQDDQGSATQAAQKGNRGCSAPSHDRCMKRTSG